MSSIKNFTQPTELSFEFFPARSATMEHSLWHTLGQLELLNPTYFSMTYGALNSEREQSINAIDSLQRQSIPVAAHLTATGHSQQEMLALAKSFKEKGVKRIVALRGDAEADPNGITDVAEMIANLKGIHNFDISVAAYPEVHPKAKSAKDDLIHLKRKLDAGASRALTQYFFDAEIFLRFRDSAVKHGINQTIVPGILPVHNLDKVVSFSKRCGANVPHSFKSLFKHSSAGSTEQQKIGIEHAINLCENLQKEGVNVFHFYTLNLPNLSFEVAKHFSHNRLDLPQKMIA